MLDGSEHWRLRHHNAVPLHHADHDLFGEGNLSPRNRDRVRVVPIISMGVQDLGEHPDVVNGMTLGPRRVPNGQLSRCSAPPAALGDTLRRWTDRIETSESGWCAYGPPNI